MLSVEYFVFEAFQSIPKVRDCNRRLLLIAHGVPPFPQRLNLLVMAFHISRQLPEFSCIVATFPAILNENRPNRDDDTADAEQYGEPRRHWDLLRSMHANDGFLERLERAFFR